MCAKSTLSGMSHDPPVAAAELRRHLRDHLDGVLRGRTFEVTRNGQVVAGVAPVEGDAGIEEDIA
jgi:antitoxin (DNA-binding transcriptional repressor) of toxin-antitoxin stability system